MATTPAPRPLAALIVAHAQLVPSLTNPRKRFDKDRLEKLALSMAPPVGILEPLVVRPLPASRVLKELGPGTFYEIIAGERRWRAAAIAKLEDIPIVVREIPDDQVIKLQLVENKNREDIHPLDEAEAMDRLLKISKAETPKTIAATIGMSGRYVQNRLHYLRLVPEVKEAFRREEITAGHVDLVMRLSADDQKRALAACFVAAFDFENIGPDGSTPVQRMVSVRELDGWIKGNVRLSVAPGSDETQFFPEIREALKSTATALPDDTLVKKGLVPAPATLLEVTDTYEFYPAKGDTSPAPLTRDHYKPIDSKKDRCEFTQRAVVVLGQRRAQLLDVCVAVGKCKKHWAHTVGQKAAPTRTPGARRPQSEIDVEKREKLNRDKERALQELRKKAMAAGFVEAKKHAPSTPTPALLKLLTLDMGGRGRAVMTWRDVAVQALEQVQPYYYSAEAFKEAAAVVALFGVKLVAPTLDKPKPAAAKVAPKKNTATGTTAGLKKAVAKLAKKKPAAKRRAGAKK